MINNIIIAELNKSGRVTIPTLGTFVKSNNKISFISFLKNDDGLFVEQILSILPITRGDAEEIIAGYVQSINQSIEHQGQFVIEEFGHFQKDANNVINFECTSSVECDLSDARVAVDEKVCDSNVSDAVEGVDLPEVVLGVVGVVEQGESIGAILQSVIQKDEPISHKTVAEFEKPLTVVVETAVIVPETTMVKEEVQAISVSESCTKSINDNLAESKTKRLADLINEQIIPSKTLADTVVSPLESNTQRVYNEVVEPIVKVEPVVQQVVQPVVQQVIKPVIQPIAEPTQKMESNDDLLESLMDTKSKKEKMYGLYNDDSSAVKKQVANRQIPINNQVRQKSGPDFVIVISILSIILAVLVSIYYFIVR